MRLHSVPLRAVVFRDDFRHTVTSAASPINGLDALVPLRPSTGCCVTTCLDPSAAPRGVAFRACFGWVCSGYSAYPRRAPRLIEAVAVSEVVSVAGDGVVVLMHVTLFAPLLQEQVIRLPCEFPADDWILVVVQPQVDEVIHRPPDATSPVILLVECRIVSRDRWQDPRPPELGWKDRGQWSVIGVEWLANIVVGNSKLDSPSAQASNPL